MYQITLGIDGKPSEENENTAEPPKEETHYEQSALFPANPMH